MNAKEFKKRIIAKLLQVDKNIKKDDLYFSQFKDSYCISYQPNYPESTQNDFSVWQNLDDTILVHRNNTEKDNTPTVDKYRNIEDFENNF